MLQWKILLPWTLDPSARGETASLTWWMFCSICDCQLLDPLFNVRSARDRARFWHAIRARVWVKCSLNR